MPHRAEDATTVKAGGFSLLVDVDGFNCPPRVVGLHLLHFGSLPVHPMRGLLSHSSHHVSSQLLCVQPAFFECSTGFPNVDALTICTWYFIHYPFLLPVWLGLLSSHQGFPEGSLRFEGRSEET